MEEGVVLQTVLDSPKYDSKDFTDVPYIDTCSVYNKETEELSIFVVNKDLEEDFMYEVDVRNFEGYSLVEHQTLHNNDLKAINTAKNPDNVVPVQNSKSSLSDGILSAYLPSASWNVIRLKK